MADHGRLGPHQIHTSLFGRCRRSCRQPRQYSWGSHGDLQGAIQVWDAFVIALSALGRVLQEPGTLLEQSLIIRAIRTVLGKLNLQAIAVFDRAPWYFRDELVVRRIAS